MAHRVNSNERDVKAMIKLLHLLRKCCILDKSYIIQGTPILTCISNWKSAMFKEVQGRTYTGGIPLASTSKRGPL